MTFDVVVEVRLRPGIADPQGATIEKALPALGFAGVSGVTVGKSIRFAVDGSDESSVRDLVQDMCDRFLTNPVIEDSAISISAVAAVGSAG